MRKKLFSLLFACVFFYFAFGQTAMSDSLQRVKDSTLRAIIHADSVKVDKEFKDKAKWEKLKLIARYPVINAGEYSGIIPVKDPTEIPDPNQDYKLLFELTTNNPDSLMKEANAGLIEVARVINLHVASGISVKKIFPVIIIHAGALNAIATDTFYKKHFKMANPNLKLIGELEKLGTKIIACGQAMAFFDIKKEDLLPEIKVSLTAQTVLTNYQLKGYVWMSK